MNLFSTNSVDERTVTLEMISRLAESNPTFVEIAVRLLRQGHIQKLVDIVIDLGVVRTAEEALTLLAASDAEYLFPNDTLFCSDFGHRRSPQYASRAIRDLLRETGQYTRKAGFNDPMFRRMGTFSHYVVPQLMMGNFHVDAALPVSGGQLALFHELDQPPLFDPDDFSITRARAFHDDGSLRLEYVNELEQVWMDFVMLLRFESSKARQYCEARNSGLLARLRWLLEPVCGEYANKLHCNDYEDNDYYAMLTLVTWAGVLVESANRDQYPVYFSEVDIRSRKGAITGWRADGIGVARIGGQKPSRNDLHKIIPLTQHRYDSCSSLARAITETLGPDVLYEIADWKFGVGDGKTGKLLTEQSLQNGTWKDYETQVTEYLAVAELDRYLSGSRKARTLGLPKKQFYRYGTIIVCLPTTGTITRSIKVPSKTKQKILETLANHSGSATTRAQVRQRTLNVIGTVRRLYRGTSQPIFSIPMQETLMPGTCGQQDPMAVLLRSHHSQSLGSVLGGEV